MLLLEGAFIKEAYISDIPPEVDGNIPQESQA